MKLRTIFYSAVIMASVGCGGGGGDYSDVPRSTSTGGDTGGGSAGGGDSAVGGGIAVPDIVVIANSTRPVAAKNYLQINNTYSSLTGVPTDDETVLSEYNAIVMQLPSTNKPESLNGFNQIAQTRLAFAYCDEYVDQNQSLYNNLSNENAIRLLLDNMIDVDVDNNIAHAALYSNLMDIMSDSDGLLGEDGGDNTFTALQYDHESQMELASGTLVMSFNRESRDRMGVFSKDASGNGDGGHISVYLENNNVIVRLQGVSNQITVSAPVPVNTDTQVAVTFGNEVVIYVDGVESARRSFVGGLVNNEEPVVIGALQWSSEAGSEERNLTNAFEGTISEVTLYPEVLIASDLSPESSGVVATATFINGERYMNERDRKLFKMSCTALLASSYVSMI